MANIIIDVAAEFTGQRAFDQAGKSTLTLERSVKKLAKAFGITFAASTIINYSKESIKAFAADEAAALRLTRAVDNLGIGFANPAISKYISDLERSASIADDILRPAFQALLTTTGSLTKSQELLNNAITISRASGIDLATVSQDLANGYVGITKGLRKYNSGLTTAELNSKSFAEVLGVILSKSAGAAQDYLSSTQYKMDALGVATNNASEIIGGGLVNAFARIAGGTEVSDAQKAIEGVATGIAHITEATGAAIGAIPNLLKMLGNLPKNIFQGFAGKAAGVNLTPTPTTSNKTELTKLQQQKALAKLESDAAKRAKELLALQKKQSAAAAKAVADKAKLDKAASIFDLQKIEIAAALKGKISEEERTRLLLMQAIQDEDAKKAEELQKKLEDIQKKNEAIAKSLTEISTVTNPFMAWADSLGVAANLLGAMPALLNAAGGLTGRGLHNLAPGDGLPGAGSSGTATGTTFGSNATPEEIVKITEDAAAAATDAATTAEESVAITQSAVDAIAESGNAAQDLATTLSVANDIASSAQSSSMFNPYDPWAQAKAKALADVQAAEALVAAGSNMGAGTSSSMFNPYGRSVGGPGFGTMNASPTIYVNVGGSVIMQDEFVKAVNDALVTGNTNGYNTYRPGAVLPSGG
jgi:hypothetical protein